MALTASEMVNEVLDNLARATNAQTRSGTTLQTMALRWLNRAQVRVFRRYDLIYKISTASTVASRLSYSFPSNLNVVYSLRLENGQSSVKLQCVMPWEMDDLVPLPSNFTTRQPLYYVPYKASNTYELFPIPNATYTLRLRHSTVPATMTINSSQSDYSDVTDIDDVLIYYATEEAYNWLQEFADAAIWRKRGDVALDDALKFIEDWPDWSPKGKGFSVRGARVIGEYYNDPLITNMGEVI